ncbi:E3 ubiquitin-protein ligase RAD18 [Vairimorpha necatrix]|uniref:E3 ubiquitin-protein ligase RAD18 n=1 Tax=Vairimorpha necatrix TaxID=6039 RepID=A0AAX4JAL1_9MICR
MNSECTICKSQCVIPHWLPCSHKFCFLCIRRHLERRNFCPSCFKSPVSPSDLRTNEIQYNKIDKIPIIINNKEDQIIKELKRRRVDISGGRSTLLQRYKELFINVDNERFREVPRNMDRIVREINKDEADNRKIKKENEKDMKNIEHTLKKLKLKKDDKQKSKI